MKKQPMTNPVSFRDRLIERQLELGLTDAEVGKAANFAVPSLYKAMLKQKFPMPLAVVPQLATVLGLDPGAMLRAAMSEIAPDFLAMVDEHLRPSELTEREATLIQQYRKLTAGKGVGPIVFYEVATMRTLVIDGV